jgi:predicted dehydrogenase
LFEVAVVGLGWWGKGIVPLLKKSGKITVIKGIDANPAAAEFAQAQGIAFDTRFEAAIEDPDVQGVVLCTPHSTHAEQIVRVANAKKHVFCEKPLCMNRADVLRAVAAVNANKVALAVGHERRFEPPVLEAFRVAKSGEIGTLLQVEANFNQDKFIGMAPDNWRMSAKEAPAGPMTATGVHLLDLSVGLLGPADRVLASVKQLGSGLTNGDTLGALVMFKSGANAMISAVLATPFDGRLAVYGNKGWVEVRDKAHPESPEGWVYTKCLRGGRPQSVEHPPAAPVLSNLEAFADAAEGRAPYPVPQEQMIANVSALEAIFKSAQSGEIVKVEG